MDQCNLKQSIAASFARKNNEEMPLQITLHGQWHFTLNVEKDDANMIPSCRT